MAVDGIGWNMIENIRLMQTARDEALAECMKIQQSNYYTDEYKVRHNAEKVEELQAIAGQCKSDIATKIAARVAALNEEEKRSVELRALEDGYLARLNAKLDTVESSIGLSAAGVARPDALPKDWVKNLFNEFADDPISIAAIKSRLGSYAVGILPDDNTGSIQKHLHAVEKVFDSVIDDIAKIVGNGLVMDINSARQREDTFATYLLRQNEDLSLDDDAVFYELTGVHGKANEEIWFSENKPKITELEHKVMISPTDTAAASALDTLKRQYANLIGVGDLRWKIELASE